MTIERGFEKTITEDLVLKVASTEEEGDRLAEFNATIHGKEVLDYVKRLYFDHPDKDEILWFYIEDTQQEKIVSAATLMPFQWVIRKTVLDVAEMGFVGTLENYRGQGLFGIINDYYELALQEREFILSVLVGIPNYYRKFGYIFCLNRFSGYAMPTNNIPAEPVEDIKVRKATEDDLSIIKSFYEDYNDIFAVSTVFDKEKLDFRLMNTICDIFNSITYIVEEDRKPKAFFSIGSLSDPDKADIILMSELTYRQMIKVLQFVKTYNMGNITSFKVNVHPSTKFAKLLKSMGADLSNDWTWQVKIPDIHQFLQALKPVLEKRIDESIFRGLNQTIKFSDYSETIVLKFEEGDIEEIAIEKGFPDSTVDLRIPSPYYTRLFLSDRSVDQIHNIITDTLVKKESKLLIETLFPTSPSIPFSYYQ